MLDIADPLARFTGLVSDERWTSLFPALEAFSKTRIGHSLFSCSVFREEPSGHWVAARVYSNDETNYPTSGLKEISPTRWTDLVISQRKPFVANTVGEFADVLADHAKIAGLGLGSVVNLPVAARGQFIGTVNLLHEAGYYTEARIAGLSALVLPSLLTFHLSQETADITHEASRRPA